MCYALVDCAGKRNGGGEDRREGRTYDYYEVFVVDVFVDCFLFLTCAMMLFFLVMCS